MLLWYVEWILKVLLGSHYMCSNTFDLPRKTWDQKENKRKATFVHMCLNDKEFEMDMEWLMFSQPWMASNTCGSIRASLFLEGKPTISNSWFWQWIKGLIFVWNKKENITRLRNPQDKLLLGAGYSSKHFPQWSVHIGIWSVCQLSFIYVVMAFKFGTNRKDDKKKFSRIHFISRERVSKKSRNRVTSQIVKLLRIYWQNTDENNDSLTTLEHTTEGQPLSGMNPSKIRRSSILQGYEKHWSSKEGSFKSKSGSNKGQMIVILAIGFGGHTPAELSVPHFPWRAFEPKRFDTFRLEKGLNGVLLRVWIQTLSCNGIWTLNGWK